jgi:hypothetical protein
MHAGKKDRIINTRFKESMGYIHLGQPQESTWAEHGFEMGHSIRVNGTSMLDNTAGYMNHLIKEALTIRLLPRN